MPEFETMTVTITIQPPRQTGPWANITLRPSIGETHEFQPESREDALSELHSALEAWCDERGKRRLHAGWVDVRPHDDYANELTTGMLLGGESLAAWGAGQETSQYASAHWYEHQPEYRNWLSELTDDTTDAIVATFSAELYKGRECTWIRACENADEFELRHRSMKDGVASWSGARWDETEAIWAIRNHLSETARENVLLQDSLDDSPFDPTHESLPEYPEEVRDWTYDPTRVNLEDRVDAWRGLDGVVEVRVVQKVWDVDPPQVVVRDTRLGGPDRDVRLDDWTGVDDPSVDDARDVAVAFMDSHSARGWSHPLYVPTAYEPPGGWELDGQPVADSGYRVDYVRSDDTGRTKISVEASRSTTDASLTLRSWDSDGEEIRFDTNPIYLPPGASPEVAVSRAHILAEELREATDSTEVAT